MKISKRDLNRINRIVSRYSGWREPSEIRDMWRELYEAGIEVGMLTNRRDNGAGAWSCTQSYTFNGKEVENSLFVYCVYEGNTNTTRNEYTIYFS